MFKVRRSLLLTCILISLTLPFSCISCVTIDFFEVPPNIVLNDFNLKLLEMLGPTCKVLSDSGTGTGTVIYAGPDPVCGYSNSVYILTAAHVVAPALPENIFQDTPFTGIGGEVHPVVVARDPFNIFDADSQIALIGKVVAKDEEQDIALICVDMSEVHANFPYVARFFRSDLIPGEEVFKAGHGYIDHPGFCPATYLGERARPSGGVNDVANAPTAFGDSGGALYVEYDEHYWYAGLLIAMATQQGKPMFMHAICVRLSNVVEFLREKGYGFILSDQRKRAHETQPRPEYSEGRSPTF